jgi:hypothetical protein
VSPDRSPVFQPARRAQAKRTSATTGAGPFFLSRRFGSGELYAENVNMVDRGRFCEQVIRFRHQGLSDRATQMSLPPVFVCESVENAEL